MEKTDANTRSTEKVASAVDALDHETEDIGTILETIRSIADQTNLLALNASIEAARAGEHGRGFAVVAEEIRKLAEQTGQATGEIQHMVSSIRQKSSETVGIMTEVKAFSEEQRSAVASVDSAFSDIAGIIHAIVEKIHTFDTHIGEIQKDKETIVSSIENIYAVSEETAASSEEVAASMEQQAGAVDSVSNSAQTLQGLAEQLNAQLDRFSL